MMEMEFAFEFYLSDNTRVSSREILKAPDAFRNAFLALPNLSCRFVLQTKEIHWTVEDELPYLMANLFLYAIPALKENGGAKYAFFECQGSFALSLQKDEVLIQGGFIEPLKLKWEDFKGLAMETAHHATTLMTVMEPTKFQPDLDYIKEALEKLNADIYSAH